MITRLFLLVVSLSAFISLSADSNDMAYAVTSSCSNANSTLQACDSQSDRYSIVTLERQTARSNAQELLAEGNSDVQAKEQEWTEDTGNNNENIESEIPSLVSAIPFP